MKKQGLSARERIKKKKDFEIIFSTGKFIISSQKRLKAVYVVGGNDERPEIKIAVAVSKKLGNAVWRNRIKRLIKESYRRNKEIFSSTFLEKKISLKIIFSPYNFNQKKNKYISLGEIMPDVVEIMNKIKSVL